MNKMIDTKSALKSLKRSIIGSGALGIILPVAARFAIKAETIVQVDVTDAVGFVLVVSAVIHLSYLHRLEKVIHVKSAPA